MNARDLGTSLIVGCCSCLRLLRRPELGEVVAVLIVELVIEVHRLQRTREGRGENILGVAWTGRLLVSWSRVAIVVTLLIVTSVATIGGGGA